MSNNHNSQEYNAVFSTDNSNVFKNEFDNILNEGKQRFINTTSLDDKYQTLQHLHNILIKEFQRSKENINVANFSNWLQEVMANASATEYQYIDINGFKIYENYIKFIIIFWNGIANWLHSKKDRDNKIPVEYPTFNGNMDCCKYYSEKILVWEHQQSAYKQFLQVAFTYNANLKAAFENSKHRNENWRHNPLNFI